MPTAAPASRPCRMGHSAGCRITTPSLGIQHQRLPDPPLAPQREIHLRSTGKILGRIVADRPEWTRGVKLSITTTSDPVDRDTKGIADVVSRGDGLFLIPAIAGGHARFEIAVDPVRPVLPHISDVGVQPDAVTNVEIRLERTVRVPGSIRDRETGHPLARAEILIGHGVPNKGEKGMSDSDGRFEVDTLSGDVTMKVVSAPGSFMQVGDDPSSRRHHVPAGVEAFDLPPIEVVRGVKVQGRLVDAADQPIANVSIYADAASGNRLYGFGGTDHDGAFTMLIPSGVPLKYRYSFDQGGAHKDWSRLARPRSCGIIRCCSAPAAGRDHELRRVSRRSSLSSGSGPSRSGVKWQVGPGPLQRLVLPPLVYGRPQTMWSISQRPAS